MKNRFVVIFIICITGFSLVFVFLKFVNTFSGSYHYAEWYLFDKSEKILINDIIYFKSQNTDYKSIERLESGEMGEYPDGYVNNYYSCTFYLKDKAIVLNCLVHDIMDSTRTKIGLLSIRYKYSNRWCLVNKELNGKENAEIKELFETEILDKLGKWQHEPKSWSDFFK